jgi:PAS domain S-box-containing protein
MSNTEQPQPVGSDRLDLLAALGARLNEEIALKPLLEASLTLILDLMRLDAGWIFLFDNEKRYYLAAATGLPPALSAGGQGGLRWGLCRCQKMLDAGELDESVNIVECERLEHARETLQAERLQDVATQTGGFDNHASIPLRFQGRTLGVLNLARRGGAPLNAEELSLLTLVGHIVSAAIHRTQLHDLVEADRLQERQALRDLSETLVGLMEPAAIARATAGTVFKNLKVDGVSVLVPVPEGTHLQTIASEGWMKEGADHRRILLQPPESGGPAWCFHTREIVYGDHSDPALPFRVPDEPRSRGVRTCIHVPMVSGQRMLGIVSANRLVQTPFTPEEARFVSLSANLAAVALERGYASDAMRAVVQASPVAIVASDLNGKITEWNSAAERMFGWTREEVLGQDPPMVPPDGREEYRSLTERLFGGEILKGVEVRRQQRDGTQIEASIWAAPMFDAGKNVIGAIGFLIDMTERKQAEEIIRRNAQQLETLSQRLLQAHEEERRAIARELHDEIGQTLTALNLLSGIEGRSIDAEKLREAQVLVSDVLTRLRDLSLNLRPALLDDLGLVPALIWHLERFGTRTGVRVDFTHGGLTGRRFGDAIETAVFRIAQEALTNVARHADVKEATVHLLADQKTIGLQVRDQGAGFNPEIPLAATSAGLLGMRERAALLGAQLTLESAPGMGTTVTAVVPLEESAHDATGGIS